MAHVGAIFYNGGLPVRVVQNNIRATALLFRRDFLPTKLERWQLYVERRLLT